MSKLSVNNRFEEVATRWPDNIAVKYLDTTITYKDLNKRANYLANYLIEHGLSNGDVVGLLMNRSIEMIISMLAILKCNASFLPLDINSPLKRNLNLLADSKAKCVITDRESDAIKTNDRIVISVYDEILFNSSKEELRPNISVPENCAYLMFTSGSTGKPKGVMVPHRAIIRLVLQTNYVRIKPTDKILQFSPPSFDASTFEIWGALLNGATLVLYSGSVLDPNLLKKEIHENQISIMWLSAGLFHLVVDKFIDALEPLHTLLAGGDVLNPTAINRVIKYFPELVVINGYGPTENTTFTCCHRMNIDNLPEDTVPIGKPIEGTQVFILDESLNNVSFGETGELFTAGQGVALGYFGEIDNDKFFMNSKIADGLIYRTGDLVRENSKGEILFVGRADNQVKIRGFRINLDEVRSILQNIPFVADAAAIIEKHEGGDQILVAYIKFQQSKSMGIAEIRHQLSEEHPNYLIPDKIVICYDDLPITKNGKVDKRSLQSQSC